MRSSFRAGAVLALALVAFASAAQAGVTILNYFASGPKYVQVGTFVPPPAPAPNPCSQFAASATVAGPIVCFNASGGNVAYASGVAGPGLFQRSRQFTRGEGEAGAPSRDGFGTFAIGDTAASDSFDISLSPINATSANLVLNGEALRQRTIPTPGIGSLQVLVYPDSVTAKLDPTRSGAGALFRGRLMVDKDGIEKADGGYSPGDFTVQLTTDRARVRATSVTKVVTCPNSATLALVTVADTSSGPAVPSSNPLTVGILALLMAGAGWMVMRRRRVEA